MDEHRSVWLRNVGPRLKRIRGSMTQAEFARLMLISTKTLGMYERGEREPELWALCNLSQRANVSLDWLILGRDAAEALSLDTSVLQTAVTSAITIVESARAQGKGYTPDQITSFIVDIYGSMIKEIVDGEKSLGQSGSSESPEGQNDAQKPLRNRKESA